MPRHYLTKAQEQDKWSLPSIETFHMTAEEFAQADADTWMAERTQELDPDPHSNLTDCSELEGWYWWTCLPGCMPDSEPMGPFDTEEEALEDAREGMEEPEDE